MKAVLHLVVYGLIFLTAYSCENKDLDNYVEGYITGTFLCDRVVNGQAADSVRGFCILLKNRENSITTYFAMDLYAFSLPNGLFTFPPEILNYTYDGSDCGPKFFPDSLISKYKFIFKYRAADKNEIIEFLCGPCFQMETTFPWRHFKQITIEGYRINQH
ncbi:MAG: hypothetical protein MUO72_12860 [Bacteroidales bacterium]|nr:hypothetical protein [Bacteroidales bacterium]